MTLGVVTCIDVCYVNIYMSRFHDRWLQGSANGGVGPCYHYTIRLNATQTAEKYEAESTFLCTYAKINWLNCSYSKFGGVSLRQLGQNFSWA